ncbi:MAG: DNA adenine methylase [Chitinophagaceae bacterium]|nr:DNA adenine methylase [Chitinophagaceae bacterium]
MEKFAGMGKVKVYQSGVDETVHISEKYNMLRCSDNPVESVEVDYSFRSPLRYPGGKTRGVEFITQFFPKNLDKLLSPFFGGGSIELVTASRGTKVFGYDLFSPLVEFWQCLMTQPKDLAEEVEKYFPLSRDRFYELQQTQTKFNTKLERAAVYYVLNRSSFSGATLSGGMSPGHPRFTETSIDRLKDFYNPNIKVRKADFKKSLAEHPFMFTYLDPPYLIKSSLYGRKGNAHKDFDHVGLADILKKREHWILSYNDCDDIRDLYAGFYIITPNWKYGMSNDKTSKEVLIFSKNFKVNEYYIN